MRGIARVCSVDAQARKAAGESHSDALHDGAPVERPATADAVEGEDADEGGEHVEDIIEAGDPLHVAVRDTGDGEDGGRVDGYARDTDPFLHDLQPDDELDPPAGVQLTGVDAEEHVDVGVPPGALTLEQDSVPDILEFSLGFTFIGAGFAAETAEDVAGFFFAANFAEPAGGFGEGPADGEEEEEGDDLEGDGEAPDEGGGSVTVEGAAASGRVSL